MVRTTRGEPDVVKHLGALLPKESKATLCAVDGATTRELPLQLRRVPSSCTHLAVSVGGNDALQNIDMLATTVGSTAEALYLFDRRIREFEQRYRAGMQAVAALGRPTVVCTIYNGNLPSENEARSARMALMMFNDVIIRVALSHRFDVIDLRTVCSETSHYANAIEPSGRGGERIARALAAALGAREDSHVKHSRFSTL